MKALLFLLLCGTLIAQEPVSDMIDNGWVTTFKLAQEDTIKFEFKKIKLNGVPLDSLIDAMVYESINKITKGSEMKSKESLNADDWFLIGKGLKAFEEKTGMECYNVSVSKHEGVINLNMDVRKPEERREENKHETK